MKELLSEKNFEAAFKDMGVAPIAWKTILVLLLRVVVVCIVLGIAFIICRYARNWCERAMTRLNIDQTVSVFVANLIQWLLFLLVVIACLSKFGIETTSFAAAVGGISVAIGLAFQGSLSNVASGVMLLVFRPYKVGDGISIKGTRATVRAIELFFTIVDTADNRRLFVPNKMIFTDIIENQTFHDTRRIDINIGLGFHEDMVRTREVLTEATAVEGVQDVQIYLNGMGSYTIDWVVRCWVKTPDYFAVKEQLVFSIKSRLDDAGIEIPYPSSVELFKELSPKVERKLSVPKAASTNEDVPNSKQSETLDAQPKDSASKP